MSGMNLLISAALLIALFYGTWLLSRRLNNWSFVDVTWSFAFAPVALIYAFMSDGWLPRRIVIAALITGWSLRLGIYLWRRVADHHPEEDPRYKVLRDNWQGDRLGIKFLAFFMAQALLVWLLMLPVNLIAGNPAEGFSTLEILGAALWFGALIGEAIADWQLKTFRKENAGDPKAICRRGMWAWSRHPNYFFQSLLWWGLFLIALPAEYGWLAILAPLAMLHFILNVTGIPLTEKLALKKRGETWKEYQRTTSAFFPLPPKTTNES